MSFAVTMGGMRWQEKGRKRGLPPGEGFRRPRLPAHGHPRREAHYLWVWTLGLAPNR